MLRIGISAIFFLKMFSFGIPAFSSGVLLFGHSFLRFEARIKNSSMESAGHQRQCSGFSFHYGLFALCDQAQGKLKRKSSSQSF
jgi:hypothetical protein